MKLTRALFFGIALTLGLARAETAAPPPIPAPDRVEVTSLDAAPSMKPAALSRKRGRALATLVSRLKWLGPAGGCDRAQYELKFFSGGKVVTDRLICFHCGCYAPTPRDPHPDAATLTFDYNDPGAQRLQKSIEQLFPAR